MQGAVVKPIRERDIQKLVSLIRTNAGELNPETSKSIVNIDASFDQSVLAELKELLPTHVFNERLTAYISELSSDSERLLKLTAKFEPTTFAKYLHRMAGSAAVFGAINLRTELLVLESSIHEVTRKQLFAKCTLIQHSAKSHLSYLKSKFDLP